MIPQFVVDPDPSIYYSDNWIALDFETTNIDKGDPNVQNNSLVYTHAARPKRGPGGQLRQDGSGLEHFGAWGYGRDLESILGVIKDADFIIAHNAKFELGWLRRLGVDLTRILCFDTQIAEYVLRGKSPKGFLTLDGCLDRRGYRGKNSLVSRLIQSGVCPSEIPRRWLSKYCRRDVEAAVELFYDQRTELFDTGQEKIFYTKCLQTPVLADIESYGMQLDLERVNKLHDDYEQKLGEIEGQLAEITGGINPNSNQQMAEFLYGTLGFAELKDFRGNPVRTDGGKPSTSQETIARLKATNKRQRRFLELKKEQGKLSHALSKYLTKFKECCEKDNGLLHAQINQTVTATGRYSSTGRRYAAQFQNFDRNFKPLFRARNDDWFIGEADEAQLEFRTAVWFGQDSQGFKDIEEQADVHSTTAQIIFEKEWRRDEEPNSPNNKPLRYKAKACSFKPLYGGTSGTPAEQKYYQAFKDKYPGIRDIQEQWVDEAFRNQQLILDTGQRWNFPDLKMSKSGYIVGNTKVRNYPVQYLATAEIVPIALIYAWHKFKEWGTKLFIINTIHDSILAELPKEEVGIFKEVTREAMEDFPREYMWKLYGLDFNVPLKAEHDIQTHWTDSDHWKLEYL